ALALVSASAAKPVGSGSAMSSVSWTSSGAIAVSMSSAASRAAVSSASGSGLVTSIFTRQSSSKLCHEPGPGEIQQAPADRAADAFGIALFAGERRLEDLAAVGKQDLGVQGALAFVQFRKRPHRGAAGAVEHRQHGPLGADRDMGRPMIEGGDDVGAAPVGGADLEADGALAGGRQEDARVEVTGDAVGLAGPLEAGDRQQGGVGDAAGELFEAGADIAAEAHDLEVRPPAQHLRGAADGGGAEAGAGRQRLEAAGHQRH